VRNTESLQIAVPHVDHVEANPLAGATGMKSPIDVLVAHERLGHLNLQSLLKYMKLSGVKLTGDPSTVQECDVCKIAKAKRLPVNEKAEHRASKPLECVHTDICVLRLESIRGSRYMLVTSNDYSRYVDVDYLKKKSQAPSSLRDRIELWEKQIGSSVKTVMCDNGTELVSQEQREYYRKNESSCW
jgi:hypothetical protein